MLRETLGRYDEKREDDERYVNTYWSRFENKWVHGDWVIYDGEQYIITGRSDDTLNIAGKRIEC